MVPAESRRSTPSTRIRRLVWPVTLRTIGPGATVIASSLGSASPDRATTVTRTRAVAEAGSEGTMTGYGLNLAVPGWFARCPPASPSSQRCQPCIDANPRGGTNRGPTRGPGKARDHGSRRGRTRRTWSNRRAATRMIPRILGRTGRSQPNTYNNWIRPFSYHWGHAVEPPGDATEAASRTGKRPLTCGFVEARGLEPLTSTLQRSHSTN